MTATENSEATIKLKEQENNILLSTSNSHLSSLLSRVRDFPKHRKVKTKYSAYYTYTREKKLVKRRRLERRVQSDLIDLIVEALEISTIIKRLRNKLKFSLLLFKS